MLPAIWRIYSSFDTMRGGMNQLDRGGRTEPVLDVNALNLLRSIDATLSSPADARPTDDVDWEKVTEPLV